MKVKIRMQIGDLLPTRQRSHLRQRWVVGCRIRLEPFWELDDGAKPENNVFRISDNTESGVNGFIPVSAIQKARACLEYIPRRAYPIA
jgi:hypothetical protein